MKRYWYLGIPLAVCLAASPGEQKFEKLDRERAHEMLRNVAQEVEKNYYDPQFHGLDFAARVRQADQQIDQASSLGQALTFIAAALIDLNDSHTTFDPPSRTVRPDYGIQMEMIGDRCYITHVRPGSDAETKGLKPGDEILAIGRYQPTRENLWKLHYVFNVLSPQGGLRLTVRKPDGKEQQLDAMAKLKQLKREVNVSLEGANSDDIWELIRQGEKNRHILDTRMEQFGDELTIAKMPIFYLSRGQVDDLLGKARKHKALILDLRDNPGGKIDTLKWLIGGMFDRDVKISDLAGRKENKPLTAKGTSHFDGKLVVLVDSRSASSSEMFARVIQLEKRGTVLGDRSEGAVMESQYHGLATGADVGVYYGVFVTVADVIMTDGRSLEHVGVTPDVLMLPTAADLAADRDPVLAHAAELCGVKLSPEKAGKLFPYEWLPD